MKEKITKEEKRTTTTKKKQEYTKTDLHKSKKMILYHSYLQL